MRKVLAIMALIPTVGFGTAAAQQTEKGDAKHMCVLKVSGMFCGACAKTVEKTAKKIDGVKAAKASQPNGVAQITFDPLKTTPEAIAKAINEKTPFKAEIVTKDKK